MQELQHLAIIGAGTQGSMLAFRGLAFGREVFLYSRSLSSRERAKKMIFDWLQEWQHRGKLFHTTPQEAMEHLHLCADLAEAVRGADFVIETVSEQLDLKQFIWRQIDEAAPAHALIASNSSSFKSSDIGRFTRRKEKTFNLNFMTPIEDDLVEVMWNTATDAETQYLALAFLRAQGQVAIVTKKEIQGFSLNRVWRAVKKESLRLWAEGYTTPEDLDRAWMLEWGTPHGPFGLMDKVGLDVVLQIELSYYAESKRADDLPPQALRDMVDLGFLGIKTGRGFYIYPHPAYAQEGWLHGGNK